MGRRVRIIGGGRAGRSFRSALAAAGWETAEPWGRTDDAAAAAHGADVVIIATPDAAIASVAASIEPVDDCVVVHLSGALGLGPLAGHPRRAVVHPLVALPDGDRGAARLHGAWFGLSTHGDPLADEIVASLEGRPIRVSEGDWAIYHASAVIASNHLVALLGQAERVAGSIGVPLGALLDLARGSFEDVVALGPAAALTGPVRRGDMATVQRHLDALPDDEREAYRAMARQAARLVPPPG
ncbi:MAG: DUF2520 domain-containing protein [Ilumatobacteraceae bacterium]